MFRKMTGKTITGFSNPSRFVAAFRKQFACNPGEYNSTAGDYKRISEK